MIPLIPLLRIAELNSRLYMLGVTGSMGCGKSYACSELGSQAGQAGIGFTHLDVDTLRRDILGVNPDYSTLRSGLAAGLAGILPTSASILDADGSCSKARLNSVIYSSQEAMETFKELLRPGLLSYIHGSLQGRTGIAALDWALLVEDDMLALAQYNALLVSCDNKTQMARLRGNDLPEAELQKRLSLQLTNHGKELRIRQAQAQAGRGQLYTFSTSEHPGSEDYVALFEQIALTIR
jgi:dephospho-CoA kinase